MNYNFIRELLNLAEQFEAERERMGFSDDITAFKHWIARENRATTAGTEEPEWEGKKNGRTPESVISTMIVHMNRYAKMYSRSAMQDSAFSTQEEFIFLITLKAYGEMTKTELIRKNVHDKPAGMLIVSRLIRQGWVRQVNSELDKRSKVLKLTAKGAAALEQIKDRIDRATKIVSGTLSRDERLELIRLLQKLEEFHHPLFESNRDRGELLDQAMALLSFDKN